jgi:hypothetical protein
MPLSKVNTSDAGCFPIIDVYADCVIFTPCADRLSPHSSNGLDGPGLANIGKQCQKNIK